jgi:hypothetical protein
MSDTVPKEIVALKYCRMLFVKRKYFSAFFSIRQSE